MDNTRTIIKINAAIAFFEGKIKQIDEIIADGINSSGVFVRFTRCPPVAIKILNEEKEHCETALAVLRAAAKFAQLESELVRH